jgi:hypothetical protein
MVKRLIKLALLLLVANAAFQFAKPFYRYNRFKADVQELALRSKGQTDHAIVTEALQMAEQHGVPLTYDDVRVRRSADLTHTYIDADWREEIEFFPAWTRAWDFQVRADGWHVRPLRPEDLR